ncbi:MAG: GspH/FimT family pseudopilin [Burkholderiales bacterium]|jgi:general secretion pathway protein H|nr:MAG: GspH/FimT family pseudopilin [Burkholderiales bacterium]
MRERGFTMVELLVVLAIAAALLAVAPMALQRYRESTDYRDTVRTMTAALTEARHSAISGGRVVAFSVDLGARHYGVDGGARRDLPESIAVRATVADTDLVDNVARIRFFPGGNATGGSIEVVRASGSGVRLRTDWLDGRVSLEGLMQ